MKMRKILAGLAVASMLVACSSGTDKDDTKTTETTANYAKVGYAIETAEVDSDGQVNTYMAIVGLDENDKVKYVSIDVAQQTPSKEDESTKTKKEKGADYGMVGSSAIGKEWYEQIASLEEEFTGKTASEINAIDTYEKNDSHVAVPTEGTDLAASVTITIEGYQSVVTSAIKNAVAVDGLDTIGMGQEIEIDPSSNEVDTTIAFVGLDSDGKVVWAVVDVAQTTGEEGANTKTKLELGADYGMKSTSEKMGVIEGGAEWYEQSESYTTYLVGKTASEIKALEVADGKFAEGTDLAASVTITVTAFQSAVAEAITNAK